jgi:hypothetical protein
VGSIASAVLRLGRRSDDLVDNEKSYEDGEQMAMGQ